MGRMVILALAMLPLLEPVPLRAAADLTGQASVIDGGTIEIHGQRIRFFGIDAPESHQTCEADQQTYRCGQQAALALADEIRQQTVTCDKHDVDRYGRIVAVCRAGGDDLNAWMVSQGWALAYRHYSTAYVGQEEAAHAAHRGIWRGTFTAPWDWRHGQRSPSDASATTGSATMSATPAGSCCKVCSTSQACGDACISKSKTCHKPPGCAQCAVVPRGCSRSLVRFPSDDRNPSFPEEPCARHHGSDPQLHRTRQEGPAVSGRLPESADSPPL